VPFLKISLHIIYQHHNIKRKPPEWMDFFHLLPYRTNLELWIGRELQKL